MPALKRKRWQVYADISHKGEWMMLGYPHDTWVQALAAVVKVRERWPMRYAIRAVPRGR